MTRAARGDVVAVVEAGYRLEGDRHAWMASVLRAAAPIFDRGRGVVAQFIAPEAPGGPPRSSAAISVGGPPDIADLSSWLYNSTPPDTLQRLSARPCGTVSELAGPDRFAAITGFATYGHPRGIRDAFGVTVLDPGGCGVILVAPLPEVARTSAAVRGRWSRVAAHLCAGLRLRAAYDTEAPEAILDAAGRVQHAEAPAQSKDARSQLRAAARAIDRARGRDADDDEALALWRALVAGRWSLVDQFDSDGRRYLVARRNDPRVRDPRALSPHERLVATYAALGHTNKLIAYEVGLGEATVATHLRAAIAKLGLRSRVELVQMLRALPLGDAAEKPGRPRR